jgi:Fe-S cluster assembly protein SufD
LHTTRVDPRAVVEASASGDREPGWLRELRAASWEAYAGAPVPDRVAHLWRYTDPGRFVPSEDALLSPARGGSFRESSGAEWPPAIRSSLDTGELAGAALSGGGGVVALEAASELTARGGVLEELRSAAARHGDLVHEHLGAAVGREHGKFEALNLACWQSGLLVYVPRNVEIERPLHLWLAAPEVSRASFCATRLLVVAEPGASVTIIDEQAGGSDRLNLSRVVEVAAAPGSRVRYAAVQRLGRRVAYHFTQRARAGQDANLLTLVAALGGGISKADLGTLAEGPGVQADLLGFLFGSGRQHFDHHTVHDHRAGHTASRLDFKAVLKDRARSAYTGLIRIAQEAATCEAYQENRNLLLTDGCRAESIPELEILNEEVICSHGATVGSLDPEHIFYLMSRGVPRREAVRMIVGGFIEPTLARLPPNLCRRLRRYVEEELEEL